MAIESINTCILIATITNAVTPVYQPIFVFNAIVGFASVTMFAATGVVADYNSSVAVEVANCVTMTKSVAAKDDIGSILGSDYTDFLVFRESLEFLVCLEYDEGDEFSNEYALHVADYTTFLPSHSISNHISVVLDNHFDCLKTVSFDSAAMPTLSLVHIFWLGLKL